MFAPYSNPQPSPQMPNNPVFNAFGGYQNFMNQFNAFAQQIRQSNQNPQMLVQQYMNNGQITQQQFEQSRMMANAILGMNR